MQLVQVAREALDEAGFLEMPVVAGVGASSTRETIKLSRDAAAAGADFVMVIPPGYYAATLQSDPRSLTEFFVRVADASPIPV